MVSDFIATRFRKNNLETHCVPFPGLQQLLMLGHAETGNCLSMLISCFNLVTQQATIVVHVVVIIYLCIVVILLSIEHLKSQKKFFWKKVK